RGSAWLAACCALLVVGCHGGGSGGRPSPKAGLPPASQPRFSDVTAAAGIHFHHENGAGGRKYMPETMGSGCAFLDYDNDGRMDILLINGMPWTPQPHSNAPTMKLYHNDGNGHFSDVTRQLGLDIPLYGMGVAVGDYDNDGWDDIFITAIGGSRLFHNEHGRRFSDVTVASGLHDEGWPTSAAWIDYDRDGKLDLFVCHYVRW